MTIIPSTTISHRLGVAFGCVAFVLFCLGRSANFPVDPGLLARAAEATARVGIAALMGFYAYLGVVFAYALIFGKNGPSPGKTTARGSQGGNAQGGRQDRELPDTATPKP